MPGTTVLATICLVESFIMASSSAVTRDSMPGSSKAAPSAVPEDCLSGAAVVTRKPCSEAVWGTDSPSPMHDEQHVQLDDDPRLTKSHDSRPSRLRTVPEQSTLFTDLHLHSAIPAASNNSTRNPFRQDVSGFVNNTAPVASPSSALRHSVHPSQLLLGTSVSSSINQHGLRDSNDCLRTSNQVFKTGEELALHYGIPTWLPPPPQPTTRTYEKQQEPASPPFDFESLRANYLNMINEKSTDNTMAVDSGPTSSNYLPSLHMDHPALDEWMDFASAYVSTETVHVINPEPEPAPPPFHEYLTSPVALQTPAQDFESSPNETPFSDFLNTPLLGTSGDELFNSPAFESDLPLIAAADEYYTAAPSSVKTKTAELPELPEDLYQMPPIPYTDVINPAWVYSTAAPRPSVAITAPTRDPSPAPESPSTTVSSSVSRRRTTATGTRKNISPDKLIPLDAPTQARHYSTASATSRKEIPSVFLKKRQRVEYADEEDELMEPLPPNATEREQIEYKRRQNTLAARKSRKRKLMHQQELENQVQTLKEEVAKWHTRCDVLSKLLDSHGIPPPSFSD